MPDGWRRRSKPAADSKNIEIEGLERRLLLSAAIAAFGDQQTYLAGLNPLSVAISDVNRDGKPDLIVANNTGDTVSVLLGDGSGAFPGRQTFSAGSGPIAVAVADVNGDGKPDLVVADYLGGTVSVLTGNGDGTFAAPHAVMAGSNPIAVAVADVNGDGHQDLLVANYGGNSISVLLGNGDGSFAAATPIPTGSKPISVAVGDINGDGKLDLAVTNYKSSSVSILLGNGDDSFQSQRTLAAGSFPRSVALADMNTDGRLDLVVSNRNDADVSVLLGNGDGTFANQTTFATGDYPRVLSVADVNGDSKPDVIVPNGTDGTISVLLGNGDGTLQPQVTFTAGTNPYAVAVADVNGDGRLDVVVANQGSNNVGVLLGDVPPYVVSINRASPLMPSTSASSIAFTVTFDELVTGVDANDFAVIATGPVIASPTPSVSGSGAVYTVTIGGISGQGTLGLNLVDDGSIRNASGNPLQRSGVLTFQTRQTFSTGSDPESIAVADFNGDGKLDLVATNRSDDNLSILLGNGNGTFKSTMTTGIVGTSPSFVVVSDVNLDGRPDLIVANAQGDFVSVLLGNGNGTFQARLPFATGLGPDSVAVGDLNADGKPDLVVANSNAKSQTISVLLGNGNGTFQPQQTIGVGYGPRSVAISDVNGDGMPDIIVANAAGNGTLSVLLGNGNGTFHGQRTLAIGGQSSSVSAADLNGDGQPDLIVTNSVDSNVCILLGNGDGTFQSGRTFTVGMTPDSVVARDINGDSIPDLVVWNLGFSYQIPSGSISILLGNGDGTFKAQQTIDADNNPIGGRVSDLNGDGSPDIVSGNLNAGVLGVMLGTTGGGFTGEVYTILQRLDVAVGSPDVDSIFISQDADHAHIDWTMGTTTAQLLIGDPNGLTINGGGSNDVIYLSSINGDPLPNTLHLNGIFTVNSFNGSNPLGGTTLDIGESTVYINYAAPASPTAVIQRYLTNGYGGGTWNGASTVSTGAITSTAAASEPAGMFGVGFADSADGMVLGQPTDTVELRYTLMGDANLDGVVNLSDAMLMVRNWGATGSPAWDSGNFNYDSTVNLGDAQFLQKNWTASAGGSALPGSLFAGLLSTTPVLTTTPPTDTTTSTDTTSSDTSTSTTPDSTLPTDPRRHHSKRPAAKHARRDEGR